jgi:hypothetical protein
MMPGDGEGDGEAVLRRALRRMAGASAGVVDLLPDGDVGLALDVRLRARLHGRSPAQVVLEVASAFPCISA